MKIEIDLNDLLSDYDVDSTHGRNLLRQAIEDRAAETLLDGFDHDTKQQMRQAVYRSWSTAIEARIANLLDEVMGEPIQRTSTWGEAKGDPVTVKDMIRESLEKWMNAKTGGRGDWGSQPQNLAQMIDSATRSAMDNELQSAVAKARKQVSDAVRDKALKAAVEALNR